MYRRNSKDTKGSSRIKSFLPLQPTISKSLKDSIAPYDEVMMQFYDNCLNDDLEFTLTLLI